jgi:hypothetical protein
MEDGLASGHIKAADITLTGSLITPIGSVATLQAGETIAAAEIEAGAIGTSEQAFVGTGSPPAYDRRVLIDTTAAVGSPNLTGYVVFGETFGAAPDIAAWLDTGASALSVANITTGSFEATAVTAGTFSGNVVWLASGSHS